MSEQISNNLFYIDNNNQTDPALNLALEEFALRNFDPSKNYLLLYCNEPSVIVGKHQNVLQEANLRFLDANDIGLYRRLSGGGTVYHDLGNLNFSFITEHTLKKFNNYRTFVKPVVETIGQLGADAYLDERSNIRVGDKKISGNAQFSSRGRMLSHGTVLFDADLQSVHEALKLDSTAKIESRASKSVPSPVTNLKDYLDRDIGIAGFKQEILHTLFKGELRTYRPSENEWNEIEKLAREKYRTWDWNYGFSPDCTVKRSINTGFGNISLQMNIKKSKVFSIDIKKPDLDPEIINQMRQLISGVSIERQAMKELSDLLKRTINIAPLQNFDWTRLFYGD